MKSDQFNASHSVVILNHMKMAIIQELNVHFTQGQSNLVGMLSLMVLKSLQIDIDPEICLHRI